MSRPKAAMGQASRGALPFDVPEPPSEIRKDQSTCADEVPHASAGKSWSRLIVVVCPGDGCVNMRRVPLVLGRLNWGPSGKCQVRGGGRFPSHLPSLLEQSVLCVCHHPPSYMACPGRESLGARKCTQSGFSRLDRGREAECQLQDGLVQAEELGRRMTRALPRGWALIMASKGTEV